MMARLALLLLAAALALAAHAPHARADPADALRQVDAQVEAQLRQGPPTGSAFVPPAMRFHATQQEVVSALNSLDVKAGKPKDDKPAAPEKHKAAVVSAFASVALETMHRASGAIHWLRQRAYALGQKVKADAHNYKTWMDGHRAHAAAQITAEVERLGSLTDEVAHLRQVEQDAISKDRSYQVQINELVSERQLQRTPPVMPAVVAAGLTDEQFNAATEKLHAVRAKAQQVIAQTRGGVASRERLIEQGTKWVEDSKLVLSKWYAHQTNVYNTLVANGKKAVAEAERRVLAVERIQADAKKFHADYVHALQRLHLEARISVLRTSLKHHEGLKAADEYEEARVKSFSAALRLEISGLEEKLKKIPGDGKVVPPPAVWGVLAQYHAFAVHVPTIHPPTYHSVLGAAPTLGVYGHGMAVHAAHNPSVQAPEGGVSAPVDPSITASVPTHAEAASLSAPGATWDTEVGNAMGAHVYNPWAAAGNAGPAPAGGDAAPSSSSSASGAFFLEQMAQAYPVAAPAGGVAAAQQQQQQQQQQAGGFPAPPVMPDLPSPPHAIFV